VFSRSEPRTYERLKPDWILRLPFKWAPIGPENTPQRDLTRASQSPVFKRISEPTGKISGASFRSDEC